MAEPHTITYINGRTADAYSAYSAAISEVGKTTSPSYLHIATGDANQPVIDHYMATGDAERLRSEFQLPDESPYVTPAADAPERTDTGQNFADHRAATDLIIAAREKGFAAVVSHEPSRDADGSRLFNGEVTIDPVSTETDESKIVRKEMLVVDNAALIYSDPQNILNADKVHDLADGRVFDKQSPDDQSALRDRLDKGVVVEPATRGRDSEEPSLYFEPVARGRDDTKSNLSPEPIIAGRESPDTPAITAAPASTPRMGFAGVSNPVDDRSAAAAGAGIVTEPIIRGVGSNAGDDNPLPQNEPLILPAQSFAHIDISGVKTGILSEEAKQPSESTLGDLAIAAATNGKQTEAANRGV